MVRLLGSFGDIIVAELAIERRRKHERLVEQLLNAVAVGPDADDTVLGERVSTVREQADARQQILGHDRLEHVQFKLTVRAADGNGHIVAHHLCGNHRERLALSRVDLARHNRRTRLVLRQRKLTKTTARTRTQVANVVGNLHKRDRDRVHRTRSLDHGIVRRKRLKLVRRSLKLLASNLADLLSHGYVKALERVQTRADGRTTLCKVAQAREHVIHARNRVFQLLHVATELLAKRERRSVLQVRAADLDDVVKLGALLVKRVTQALERWEKLLGDLKHRGNVHRGREGIVAALRAVHMVVGVHRRLGANLAAEHLDGTVRDNLIHIHVRLRARTRLEDDQRKVVVKLAADHLVSSAANRIGDLGVQAVALVDNRSSLLEHTKSLDDLNRHALTLATNAEVDRRALRLAAPVLLCRHLELAHRVLFNTELALTGHACSGQRTHRQTHRAHHAGRRAHRALGQHSQRTSNRHCGQWSRDRPGFLKIYNAAL